MNVNITYNDKPLIEPKFIAGLNQINPTLNIKLETNDNNIEIIKDIKDNFVTLNSHNSFFFMETKEKVYAFSCLSFFNKIPNNLIFVITLINEDKTRNEIFDHLYISIDIQGLKE